MLAWSGSLRYAPAKDFLRFHGVFCSGFGSALQIGDEKFLFLFSFFMWISRSPLRRCPEMMRNDECFFSLLHLLSLIGWN